MSYKERLEALYRAGFTTVEITHLAGEPDQASADLARLRFIRWPVANGRLSDQLT